MVGDTSDYVKLVSLVKKKVGVADCKKSYNMFVLTEMIRNSKYSTRPFLP